ncbi:hypothetical protein N7457_003945 [Penicillium paradoxum]|uniref:uncharacterized protein n=1 Tax=Penicillium paradoxum TaxID=176176 RepID=UPI002547F879|nr:uncharacterized protein N7457_003945 [Penicillium paradoxum]KAJ5782171.1 hypothetical protein N7457_003945 [Penicillium paradoxum]
MEVFSPDQPRRARRSSISEHIHRVFNKSSDKRRSQNAGFVPPVPFLAREALAQEATSDKNSYARHSLYDETGPSSISHSSMNSRLPSAGTPGSSLSVAPGGRVEDDTPTQQMTPLATSRPHGNADNICKSPTWDKPKKKEKRVTKRLEAERKELEKRLLALEDAQSKADLGIYERSSRRLTKKQPVNSSSRDSSVNSERPRSSSGLSSLFRRSRRNSNSSDLDFPSPEFSQLRTDTNPPSLPLTLPERFGTAITRELQSKHGTALNLSASKMSSPTYNRSLHVTAKSDSLRENWKMAEAWKTKNDGYLSNRSVSEQIPNGSRSIVGNDARNRETLATNLPSSDDLDRELFSAALRHDRKHLPAIEHPPDRVNRHDRSARTTSMPMSQNLTQPDLCQPYPESPTQVITALLPLALNPANTDEPSKKDSILPRAPPAQNLNHSSPLEPQLPIQPYPEDRGRSRLPIASSNGPQRTSSRFKENFQDAPQAIKPPEIPVKSDRRSQENRRVSSTSTDTLRDIPASPFQVSVRSPFHTGSVSPGERSNRRSRDLSDETYTIPARSPRRTSRNSTELPGNILSIGGPGGFIPGHSRTPSYASSHDGNSNYDTADEDTPESPGFKRNSLAQADLNPPTPSAIEVPVTQEPPASRPAQPNIPSGTHPITQPGTQPGTQPVIQPGIQSGLQPSIHPDIYSGMQSDIHPDSPQIRPGPMSILKRRSQKAKAARIPVTIAKIFVICCRCKYWHDLPSEVYARLACPERLGTDLKTSRSRSKKQNDTGPRKLTGSRSLPFGQFPAAHAAQNMPDLRPAPLLPRKVTCCWCGHNMSRSCCEGWTTVVEMRERHH